MKQRETGLLKRTSRGRRLEVHGDRPWKNSKSRVPFVVRVVEDWEVTILAYNDLK